MRSKDFIVLNLGYAKTTHHWGNKDISSPFLRIYYAKQGRARLHLPTGDLDVEPGSMYLLPGYVPHSYDCDPGFEFYYLFVFFPQGEAADLFERYDFPTTVKGNHATQLLFENYCMLYPQLNLPYVTAEDFDCHPSYHDYANAYLRMSEHRSTAAISSLVVVFPFVPVSPITGKCPSRTWVRCHIARS